MKRRQDRFRFERKLISLAVISALSGHAQANPTGAQVAHGQASFATHGNVLTVTNSPSAILNWQTFSIGQAEVTRFVQQSASSSVLNRVVGVDPSIILGALQSNGRVFLLNPNGILFGQGARIDVAGLVASTLNLSNDDFLAGRLTFQGSPLSGDVVNRGFIATPEGGSVYLVGTAVENNGIIHAPNGDVILAAGQSVRLGSTGAPNVLVEVQAPDNRAVNLGEIAVGGGTAGIYGGFVEQKGVVSADTATVNAAGRIVFKASRDVNLGESGVVSANGGRGGSVTIESGGTTLVDGRVSATAAAGAGGSIRLLGEQVGVVGSATVDASGTAGGGSILVGGDYKGANLDVPNARAVFVGPDTLLRADATDAGNGGRIIVWSDSVTRAYGDISARGGAVGGNGGFVETSSAGHLDVTRAPDLVAPAGHGGTWLIDPYDITVVDGSVVVSNTGVPNFTPNDDNSVIGAALIDGQLNGGNNVTIDTSGAGGQEGNITITATIEKTTGGEATLSFLAHNDIRVGNGLGAAIRLTDGHLRLIANQDNIGAGDVIIDGTGLGNYVDISVTQASVVSTMELSGRDVVFQNGQNVWVHGTGTQTITATRDVILTNNQANFTSVGAQGLMTLNAGRDLVIEGLGSGGGAVLAGQSPNVGPQMITVGGDIRMTNADNAGASIDGLGQTITARSIRITGASGGLFASIFNEGGAQEIHTTGAAPTSPGWGIEFVNNGMPSTFGIMSNGTQEIEARDGNGILLNAAAGPLSIFSAGQQTIVVDGAGANSIVLFASLGTAEIIGNTQSITAGSGSNAGSITIVGGTAGVTTAGIYSNGGTQTVSVVGLLSLEAGSAPDAGQGNFRCDLQACANLGQNVIGQDQVINVGSILLRGGSGGGRNEGNIFARGNQTVTAPGGIVINGGAGTGPGNWGSLAAVDGTGFVQTVDFGAGGLTMQVAPTAGEGTGPSVFSSGSQVITGTGDIVMVGGVAGRQVWGEINGTTGQSITVRSISITNTAGNSSTGIFAPDGLQEISTTGSAANGYGITIRNLGATGIDQNSAPVSAYIYDRDGTQIIDVANSNGILLDGVGGNTFLGTDGVSQTITIYSSGTNRLDLTAGLGNALVVFSNGTAQEISAGAINLAGGTADGAAALIAANHGTQTIDVTGAITLTGGSAPGPDIPDLNNPPADCVPVSACAVIFAGAGLQTISADGITITGGSAGTENLATIRGDVGQDITVGAGGLHMQGGSGDSASLRNFAYIENNAGDQILSFSAGAPLELTGGTVGRKHFAAIQANASSTSQQVLGDPAIVLTGGASGGGTTGGTFETFEGNDAYIGTDIGLAPISQTIHAQSIDLLGGGGTESNALIANFRPGGLQEVTVTGDVFMSNGGGQFADARVTSIGEQHFSARTVRMFGEGGDARVGIETVGGDQTIATSGANPWGIELTNDGASEVYIRSSGNQLVTATDGGGILLDAVGGRVDLRANGAQTLTIDGDTSPNAFTVRATAGAAEVRASSQSIIAGTGTHLGSITLQGGTANFSHVYVFADAGTQEISTSGPLSILGGAAPDIGQPPLQCDLGGACSLIGALLEGSDPTATLQAITATGGLHIVGGSSGAHNDTGIFSRGSEVINAPGGITLQAGGGGPNNFATIAMDRAGYTQTVDFGTGGLTILATTAGADGNYAEVFSSGTQTITGTSDIRLEGGIDGGRSWAHITGVEGQDITARSVSITALAGPESVYIYNDTGIQRITTTGGEGGSAAAFGLTVRNAGANGTDHAGFRAAAAITSGFGEQIIDVADSAGVQVLGDGGYAVINAGQFVPANSVNNVAVSQRITVHGGGANAIVVQGNGGAAELFSNAASQQLIAGQGAEQGSIVLQGGHAEGSGGMVTAQIGTQSVATTGALTITGGTAAEIAPINFVQDDCLPACASITGHGGPQTVAAGSVLLQGGASGSENLASITSDNGQSITIHGAGGLRILGGGASGTSSNHSNFAIVDNHGGAQVITFDVAGAPLIIDAGDSGMRHFAGLYQAGRDGGGQQILGRPNITIHGGDDTSGGAGPNRLEFTSNFAFLASESGAQQISATSLMVRSGGAPANDADIPNWGGDLPGSVPGSQTIDVSNDMTLEGHAGRVRIYSHSGDQTITAGSVLLQKLGTGDVVLGNVFDPLVANIGTATVTVDAAQIRLEGGRIWADEALVLSAGGFGGTVTAGSIKVGILSGASPDGDVVVDAGASLWLSGPWSIAGGLGNAGTTTLAGGSFGVQQVSNSGLLELETSAADVRATLALGPAGLTNTASSTLRSTTAGGESANVIDAGPVTSAGTLDIEHGLQILNGGRVFENTGTIGLAAGQSLEIIGAGGTTRLGGSITGTGTLSLLGQTLDLATDFLIPAAAWQLEMDTTSITAATPVALTNQGALDLTQTTVAAQVTLVNEGTLTLQNTSVSGLMDNRAGATVDAKHLNNIGALQQAGALRIHGDDVLGGGFVEVVTSVTNTGLIELEASPNGFVGVLALTGTGSVFTNANAGILRSIGASTAPNQLHAAATFDNQGLIDVVHPLTLINGSSFDSTSGFLEIAAGQTLTVEGGTTRIGLDTDFGTSTGTLDVAGTSTLELDSNLTIPASGWKLGLSGNVSITSTGAATLTNQGALDLANDNWDSSVTLVNQGALTLRNTFADGVLDNALGATIDVSGGNAVGGVGTQAGTLRVHGSDVLGHGQLSVAGSVTNTGVIELEASPSGWLGLLVLTDPGSVLTNANTGMLRSVGLAGATAFNQVVASVFDNLGTIDALQSLIVVNGTSFDSTSGVLQIAADKTLTVTGGTTRIGGSTDFSTSTGTLEISAGTLELDSDLTVPASGWKLALPGSVNITSSDGAILTNQGIVDLTNDSSDNSVTLVNLGAVTLDQTNAAGTLNNRGGATVDVLRNSTLGGLLQDGTVRVHGSDVFGHGQLNVTSSVTNTGVIELETSPAGWVGHFVLNTSGSVLTNAAAGVIRSSNTGTSASPGTVQADVVVNAGLMDADHSLTVFANTFDTAAGTLQIASGQTLASSEGTTHIGGGTDFGTSTGVLQIAGTSTLQLDSDITLPAAGWQLVLDGTVSLTSGSGVTLTNQSVLEMRGVTFTNLVTIANEGTLNLLNTQGTGTVSNAAGATIEVTGMVVLGGLSQDGTLRLRATDAFGNAQLNVNTPVTNTGMVELETAPNGSPSVLAIGNFTNSAAGLVRSINAGTSANANLIVGDLLNQGVIDVQHSLHVSGAQTNPNAGTFLIASGARLSFTSDYTNGPSGIIQGNGDLDVTPFGGFTFTNAGRLRPGTSPGHLTITGNLVLAPTSVFDLELEGTGAAEFDTFTVTGTAALGGTLNVLFPAAYQGAIGDTFPFLTAAAVSGTFANVTQPADLDAVALYGGTSVTLELRAGLNRWTGTSGAWDVGSNWSRGVAPRATHDAVVDVIGTAETITMPSGTFDVHNLLLSENLLLNGSTLNVGGDVTVNPGASLRLFAANVAGPGTVTNNGNILALPSAGSTIANIAANTGSIIVQSDATTLGQLIVTNGFDNAGIIRLTAGGVNAGLGVANGTLSNSGTIVSEGTSGSSNHLSGNIANLGTLQVNEALRLDNVGTTFTQGAGGDVNIAAGELVFVNGGRLDLQGALTVDTGAAMRLGAVTANGTGSLVNQGTLILDSFNTVNAPVNNQGLIEVPSGNNTIAGTLTQTPTGIIRLQAAGASDALLTVSNGFTNQGTIELQAGTANDAGLTVTSGVLTNALTTGVIRSTSAGAAGANQLNAALANQGLVDVQHDLSVGGTQSAGNTGTMTLAPGATLSFASDYTNAPTGVIQGDGTVDLTGHTLTNAGTLRPGASPGRLTIDGDLTLTSTSIIDAEVAGTGNGQFDVIDVTGRANLNGTLNVIRVGGFAPVRNNGFRILIGNLVSGTFTTIQSPADFTFAAVYSGSDVMVNVANATNRWGSGSGLWTADGNWILGRAPTAGDDVVIGTAGQTVTVPVGTVLNVGSVTVSATGAVLAVDGTTDFDTLSVSQGTVMGAGAVNVGTLNLSGSGALSGTGTLTVTNAYNAAVGTVVENYSDVSITHHGNLPISNTLSSTNTMTVSAQGGSMSVANGGRLSAPALKVSADNIGVDNGSIGSSGTSTLEVSTPGQLALNGNSGPAKLFSSGTMNVQAGSVMVTGGAFAASIDPIDLNLAVPGSVVLTGGSANNAYALIAGNNVTITAASLSMTGGSADNTFAGVEALTGGANITILNNIVLTPGSGQYSGAGVTGPGPLTITTASCTGCNLLAFNPLASQSSEVGLFGSPVILNLGLELPIDNSILYAAQIAQTGGKGNAELSDEEETDQGEDGQPADGQGQEKDKNAKPLLCM